jgi:hypothetical protein
MFLAGLPFPCASTREETRRGGAEGEARNTWKRPSVAQPLPPCFDTGRLAASYAHFIVTGAAIDRAVILGKEWHLGLNTAFSTNNSVHFAWRTIRSAARRGGRITTGCTTGRAATRLIHQPFLLVELLFTGGEYEIITAFTALQSLVNETQLGPPCDVLVFHASGSKS